MSFNLPKPKSGGDFEPCPEGTHLAVCCRIIDLGTAADHFGNHTHKIAIGWETPDEKMSDGRPYLIHKEYSFSTHKKANLRKDLEAWRGKSFEEDEIEKFDISKLIGKGCLITIMQEKSQDGERTFSKVKGVVKPPKGTQIPALTNEGIVFQITSPLDLKTFEKLTDYWKNKIRESDEYQMDQFGKKAEPVSAKKPAGKIELKKDADGYSDSVVPAVSFTDDDIPW